MFLISHVVETVQDFLCELGTNPHASIRNHHFLTTVHASLFAAACIFFTPFFTAVYIVEWLILQTIYLLKKEILQFLGLLTIRGL
jgi:hypothetical protein